MTTTTKAQAWLVFFGTSTTIVKATSARDAYHAFLKQLFPTRPAATGYFVPPGPDEVHLRPLTDADLGWIDDSGDTRFASAARKALT